jgi:hypothetical protein
LLLRAKAVSSTYKTQAFESMAWLCPDGVVAMSFPAKYAVEMYQPCQDAAATHRLLICGKMKSRDYTPMASSNGLRYTIPQVTQTDTMVALLVPPAQLNCVVIEDGLIDFGKTMLRVLGSMGETQYGCSLGCYDCSLEMELVHAAGIGITAAL